MENDEYTPEVEQDENENNEVEETEEEETTEPTETSKEDETDWKAEALKYKAILDRNKNKKAKIKTEAKKSDEFDYGELAFLNANDIKDSDEIDFAKKLQKQTGQELRDLIGDEYFQSKLNSYREGRATEKAMPKGSKRSNNSTVDSVDYWIAKGELPPVEQRELRYKVVNARIKKEEAGTKFYNSK